MVYYNNNQEDSRVEALAAYQMSPKTRKKPAFLVTEAMNIPPELGKGWRMFKDLPPYLKLRCSAR